MHTHTHTHAHRPYKVKIYEGGKDAVIQYEESQAAHAAPAFFDGEEWKGVHIKVRTRFIC